MEISLEKRAEKAQGGSTDEKCKIFKSSYSLLKLTLWTF